MLKVIAKKLEAKTILHLKGRILNGVAITTLREAVFAEAGASTVVLDLGRVDLINARGLGVLLELRKWTESQGIEFRLTNVGRRVREVLKITRLDSVFNISSSEISSAQQTGPRRSEVADRTPSDGFEFATPPRQVMSSRKEG
jgi:anti-anti-sigma factor